MEKGRLLIWMQMLGFERNDPDRGAKRYLERIGFTPDGIVALLYHPDIVHLHKGMEKEYRLFDDNAAYYAIPRNTERERQPWTNHDLRTLCAELKKLGVGFYAGLMAPTNDSKFHREWIEDHGELRYVGMRTHHSINVLKRFKDGSYYEDFFAEKLKETLVDYGMEGVHFSDMFCPSSGTRAYGDFSTDMVGQFLEDTGITAPQDIAASLGDDSADTIKLRQKWLWSLPTRYRWLDFYARRWERFFKKVCGALHSVGKKVMILGQYCSDPFETLYCIGLDMRTAHRAGVDAFTPNTLPTGVLMESDMTLSRFWRYMTLIPLTAAFLPGAPLYTMIGVQDASEEWNVLKHAPVRFERDLLTEQSFRIEGRSGSERAAKGYLICLGDGIAAEDWSNVRKLFGTAFSTDAAITLSPAVFWSDAAFDRMLSSYCSTLRWTVHKTVYELARRGAPVGAAVRAEELKGCSCPVLAPCFDLLDPREQTALAEYPHPVLCTAGADFDPASAGFRADFVFKDRHSPAPQIAFGKGFSLPDGIDGLLSLDGGDPDVAPESAVESQNVLSETLNFRKVSEGFVRAAALALKSASDGIFRTDCPYTAYKLKDGKIRLYLFNPDEVHYRIFAIEASKEVSSAEVKSSFPCLPTKFEKNGVFSFDGAPSTKFRIKLAPDGVSVVDVTFR